MARQPPRTRPRLGGGLEPAAEAEPAAEVEPAAEAEPAEAPAPAAEAEAEPESPRPEAYRVSPTSDRVDRDEGFDEVVTKEGSRRFWEEKDAAASPRATDSQRGSKVESLD